jgi:hypothetical protein
MDDDEDKARKALLVTVTEVLRRQSRCSAHPADQAAMGCAARRIAEAVEADFLIIPRHHHGPAPSVPTEAITYE